jgi:hypothetical protein
MMGMRMPETCWAVFKRQAINLRNCCIWLVDSFERTRQTDVKFDSGTVLPSCLVCYWFHQFIKVLYCFECKTPRIVKRTLDLVMTSYGKKLTSTDRHCPRKTRGTMAAWPARTHSWKLRITGTTQTLRLPSPFFLTLFYPI